MVQYFSSIRNTELWSERKLYPKKNTYNFVRNVRSVFLKGTQQIFIFFVIPPQDFPLSTFGRKNKRCLCVYEHNETSFRNRLTSQESGGEEEGPNTSKDTSFEALLGEKKHRKMRTEGGKSEKINYAIPVNVVFRCKPGRINHSYTYFDFLLRNTYTYITLWKGIYLGYALYNANLPEFRFILSSYFFPPRCPNYNKKIAVVFSLALSN